ncbi:hypothetical protein [Saprospira grandis]|nr:hypothetical protein [Saprospira grandis]
MVVNDTPEIIDDSSMVVNDTPEIIDDSSMVIDDTPDIIDGTVQDFVYPNKILAFSLLGFGQ